MQVSSSSLTPSSKSLSPAADTMVRSLLPCAPLAAAVMPPRTQSCYCGNSCSPSPAARHDHACSVSQQHVANHIVPSMPASPTVADAGSFEPCMWADLFATYTPPPMQRSEEWMRARADKLKRDVAQMFEDEKTLMSMSNMLTLVDTLQHLGINLHFREEIDSALGRVCKEDAKFASCNDLHIVALRFRLLRQHGFWVSPDVFDKFRDGSGSFSAGLCDKTRDLLSLYNAAYMAVPGEVTLDDAIAFARRHLESMKGKLSSPMAEQVSRALDIPLPRVMQRLELMHYIVEYELEDTHNRVLLELAKLDFYLTRSLYLKELRELTLWWRTLYKDLKLSYSRDRLVEMYFSTIEMLPWEECSRSRIIVTKVIALVTLMDDTYDVHASFEECQKFDEAIQRWEESAVSILPNYLRELYLETLSHFNEFKDMLKPQEKYRADYMIKKYKEQSKLYLKEAQWFQEKTMPTFNEHEAVTAASSFGPTLCLIALIYAEEAMATKEAVEWAFSWPDMYVANGKMGRFLNDIASYKNGKNQKDVASSIECYAREHGVTGDEAAAAVAAMVEHAWRSINKETMEMDHTTLSGAQIVVGISRTLEVLYLNGRDGYTFGRELKDIIVPLLLEPIKI